MKFSQDFIEKVRESTNILDIISQYTQLKRTGHNHVGVCPFPDHTDKTPSFSVNENKQLYYCFGCKKAGNLYTFVQAFQGLSFPEAVEYLAQRAGIPLPKESEVGGPGGLGSAASKEREERKLLWRINEFAAHFFHQQLLRLPLEHRVRGYLKGRGLSAETIAKFQIGFAPDSWDSLLSALEAKKIPLFQAQHLGLIKARSQGEGQYDVFRNRVMFPIVSPQGRYIGFGGRVLGNDLPKYINSPESKVFHKGRIFYGLHETAKFISAKNLAIVVEGYTDFISLYQAGITNVVAVLGTALTAEHARLLGRYTKNVVILFDGDSAGQAAAEKSLSFLLAEGLFPRGLTLADKMDPDEFIKTKGAQELVSQLERAPELFRLVMDRKLSSYQGGAADKVGFLDQIGPVLLSVKDERLKDLYVHQVAEVLEVSGQWVLKSLSQARKQGGGPVKVPSLKSGDSLRQEVSQEAPEATPESVLTISNPPKAELFLINLALGRREYMEHIEKSGAVEQFTHPGLRQLFLRILDRYRQIPSEFDNLSAYFANQVEPASTVSLHLDGQFSEQTQEGALKLISDCLLKIRRAYASHTTKQLALALRAQGAGSVQSEQKEKLERIMNVQRQRLPLRKESGASEA